MAKALGRGRDKSAEAKATEFIWEAKSPDGKRVLSRTGKA
jgi:type IV pilus assembly protein PilC